jgi:SEC-C motif-containing protein
MTTTGRNDPCPCGSGRKFKRCCLGNVEASAAAYTREERQAALDRLLRLSMRQEFVHLRADAEAEFWGEWRAQRSEDDLRRAIELDESHVAFQEWFAFDYRLPGGSTLIELLLDREGDRLRTGEQRYLERMRESHLRPYEVTGVRLDEGLDLRDLWTGQTIQVREKQATHQLVQWDLLIARVVLGEHGVPVIDGYLYLLPATVADPLLRRLRHEHQEFTRLSPDADLAEFFKQSAPIPFHFWLDQVALRPLPTMVSAEGDELSFGKTVFDVLDAGALAAALASHPALDLQDDGSYVWFEDLDSAPKPPVRSSGVMISSQRWPPEDGPMRRGLGTVIVKGGRLVLETMSRERAKRGRRLLEEAAGRAIKFKATRYESVERAMERVRARPRSKDPGIPPEIQAELVQQFMEQHYRSWPDQPLPALGNRTPREAAKLGSARPALIALLKEMEVMAARDRRAGRPAYDFSRIWAELGLERS